MPRALILVFIASFLITACAPERMTEAGSTTVTAINTNQAPTNTPAISLSPSVTPSINVQPETAATLTTQPTLQITSTSTGQAITNTQAIIIDHTSVALFEQIPERYVTAARNLRLMFSDRSVGANINVALDCLTASSWDKSRAYCRNDYINSDWDWKTFNLTDWQNGSVPSRILFSPDFNKYNRDNWTFEARTGGWSDLTKDFIESLAPQYINSKDVLSYQFTYLNVTDNDDIADATKGFFANNPNKYDIYDLEAYISQHPDKTFFFWTTSLARSVGTQVATDFNNQMRQYARENNKILFDVADIESFTDQDAPCFDNRDGIQYCSKNSNKCENYPDDHQDFPAICQDYTTETEGGHLGSVSGGGIRLAKAYWVLMARIAGWDGVSS